MVVVVVVKKNEKNESTNKGTVRHVVDSVINISSDTVIEVVLGDETFRFKPINVVDYHRFLKQATDDEGVAIAELVSSCSLDGLSFDDVVSMPVGYVDAFLKALMDSSFLRKNG